MGKTSKKKKGKAGAGMQARRSKFTMFGITLVVCMLFGVLLHEGYGLQQRIIANDERQDQLATQIDQEKERTKEINDLREYMQTDEYIESAAQEKLGLVKENEIIFKAKK